MSPFRRATAVAATVLVASGLTVATPTLHATAAPPPSVATLTLVIEEVRGMNGIETGLPDFFPRASLAGGPQLGGDTLTIDDEGVITPDWTFTTEVDIPGDPYTATTHLNFQIWDDDGGFNGPDDPVDITAGAGNYVDLAIDVGKCLDRTPDVVAFTGSVNGRCGAGLVTSGVDEDRASVRFRVEMTYPDSDGDGLYDDWEINGYDADGDGVIDIDLPALGATWDHKDLFLEMDFTTPIPLDVEDINAMVEAFARAPIDAGTRASEIRGGRDAKPNPDGLPGIRLHVDTGAAVGRFSGEADVLATCADGIDNDGNGVADAIDPACNDFGEYLDVSSEAPTWAADCADGADNDGDGRADAADPSCALGKNLGGGGVVSLIPDAAPVCKLDASFYAMKAANFDPDRARIFRWALVTPRDATCPSSGGWGETGGNDFLVFNTDGGTVMHELGHNLNLDHGGFEAQPNCKPNYVSIMNYDNQGGIRRVGGGSILDFSPGRIALTGATRSAVPAPLIENALNETDRLDINDSTNQFVWVDALGNKRLDMLSTQPDYSGDAFANPADEGDRETGLTVNVNNVGADGNPADCANALANSTLTSQNDWLRISLPFRQFGKAASGIPELTDEELRALDAELLATDLAVTVASPATAVAGESFTVTVAARNDGPRATTAIVSVPLIAGTTVMSAPTGCTVEPAGVSCVAGGLAVGASQSFAITLAVDADLVHLAGAPVPVVVAADVAAVRGGDPDTSNNHADATTTVYARGDLSVEVHVPTPPAEIIIGQSVDLDVAVRGTNAGPSSPMDSTITVGISPTAGTTSDPATRTVALPALAVGAPQAGTTSFALGCAAPGEHTFTVGASIAPSRPDDADPQPANDSASTSFVVDCVIPVAINIKPGGAPNSVNRNSGNDIPVAVLTTVAGEYGLPLAVDTTKVQPLTVRFAPRDVVSLAPGSGVGAVESHRRVHLERSIELNEKTKDSDLDAVLHFVSKNALLTSTTTEGCVKGKLTGPAGESWTFFGCDAVRVVD